MAENDNTPTAPDYAGYPSPEELARGYRASSAEAKRLAAENQRLQETLQQSAANPRQDIPNRNRPEDRLAEFGIPADALNEFVNERVGQALRPLAEGFQARNRVMAEYPDYQKFEADVANYVNSDPDFSQRYNRMFAADPVGAMELAMLKFTETKRKSSPKTSEPGREESVHAAIPTQRSGETRKPEGDNSEEVAAAWKQYQKTGSKLDAEAYARARLHTIIKDDFLRQ